MMFSTLIIIIINYCAINFFTVCNGMVKVESLFIPAYVENGTEDSVVLDCVYTLDPEEDKNLVVKWFFDFDPEPIYQWIPELNSRHYSIRIQGHVNQDFSVNTDDPLTKYRAINLLRPTIEMSGKYTCQVTSLSSHNELTGTMIVFAKPKSVNLNYTRFVRDDYMDKTIIGRTAKIGSPEHNWPEYKAYKNSLVQSKLSTDSQTDPHYSDYGQRQSLQQQPNFREQSDEWKPINAQLKCEATNVYPKPEMTIYWVSEDNSDDRVLTETHINHTKNPNGSFNVSVTSDLNDSDLIQKFGSHRNNFECLLFMPDGTKNNILITRRVTYLTIDALLNSSVSAKSDFKLISILFSILMFLGLKFS